MQKQDYAGLSRTFDVYFPDVKQLVEQTELYHNKLFTQNEERTYDYGVSNVNSAHSRYIGTLEINRNDNGYTLPRLYFKKEADGTNPYFYAITTPDDNILYIGTSIDDAKPKATTASISAITGGIVPFTETKQLYIIYLGILSAIKRYGRCKVYEIKTGYEDIKMVGLDGKPMPKKDVSKYFAPVLSAFITTSLSFIPVINLLTTQLDDNQKTRDEEIWDAVSTFKGMIRNRIIGKFEEKKQETDENQEITIYHYGDSLVFNFKNKVSVMSPEDCESSKESEFERFISPSAKILCQTGDTVYDKYTAYIAHKVKTDNKPNEQAARKFIKKQSELSSFEQTIIDAFPDCKHIEYQNIYLGEIEHKIKNYSLLNNGGASRIIIDIQKTPDIASIRSVVCAIYSLFDLDLGLTKTMLCF